MANPEHLKILKQGVEVWNRWREENPDTRPNLSGVELPACNLKGIDFANMDLTWADLPGADLRNSVLAGADLKATNLEKANLAESNLIQTSLAGASFNRASLRKADLRGAKSGSVEVAYEINDDETPEEYEIEDVGTGMASADLSRADLSGADLYATNLDESNLQRARLYSVNLFAAGLEGADLREAEIFNSNFSSASLADADFRGAILHEIDFTWAHLVGADLSGVRMANTKFLGVDLSQIVGLDRIWQVGPAFVDTDTISKTARALAKRPHKRGDILSFMRGAGVPEEFISTFVLMIENPLEFYSCFISYSHDDMPFARRIHDQLQARGIRCWLDEHEMKPGDRILDVVDHAIRFHDKILLCCSETSLNSWWVKDEVRKAMERERREGRDIIIPLMVDRYLLDGWEDGLAADLRSRLAADFTGWEHDNAKFEEQFERVVKALRTDDGK